MNPLLNNCNSMHFQNSIPPHFQQGIQQVKSLMQMMQSSPATLLQQHPMMLQLNQVAQSFKGQNLQSVFMNMCKDSGVDPNAIIRELQY